MNIPTLLVGRKLVTKAYENYKNMLKPDEMLIFTGKGRKDERSGGMSFVCDRVITIEEMRVSQGATLLIEVNEGAALEWLSRVLSKAQSSDVGTVFCEVSLLSKTKRAELLLNNRYVPSDDLANQLRGVEGVISVKYSY